MKISIATLLVACGIAPAFGFAMADYGRLTDSMSTMAPPPRGHDIMVVAETNQFGPEYGRTGQSSKQSVKRPNNQFGPEYGRTGSQFGPEYGRTGTSPKQPIKRSNGQFGPEYGR